MVTKRLAVLSILALSVGAAFTGTLWNLQEDSLQGQLAAGSSVTIDDGDAGFRTAGQGWQRFQHALGYGGDLVSPAVVTDPNLSATWTFSNVTAGSIKIYVTFKAYSLLTNQAPYTIKDGVTTIGTATVNQKVDPAGNVFDGKNWVLLGTYTVRGPTVSVTLSRPQALTTNGVIADAVRIERAMSPAQAITAIPRADSGFPACNYSLPYNGCGAAQCISGSCVPNDQIDAFLGMSPPTNGKGCTSNPECFPYICVSNPRIRQYPMIEPRARCNTTCDYSAPYNGCQGNTECINNQCVPTGSVVSSARSSWASQASSASQAGWWTKPSSSAAWSATYSPPPLPVASSVSSSAFNWLPTFGSASSTPWFGGNVSSAVFASAGMWYSAAASMPNSGYIPPDAGGESGGQMASDSYGMMPPKTGGQEGGTSGGMSTIGDSACFVIRNFNPIYPSDITMECSMRGGVWNTQMGCCTCQYGNTSCDPNYGECRCCPDGTLASCTFIEGPGGDYPTTRVECTCQPVECPPGYYVGPGNVCLPVSQCGDGYLEPSGIPREVCETGSNEGCPVGRNCIACKSCSLCGNTTLEPSEACEADYSCGEGSACDACACSPSATPLTANVTTTLNTGSPNFSTSTTPQNTTLSSWSLQVLPHNTYDIYVQVTKGNPNQTPCPPSFWRVYDGSRQVQPLFVPFGSPLCPAWPDLTKTMVWIKIGQVAAASNSLRVEHAQTPPPTPSEPMSRPIVVSAIRIVKNVSSTLPPPLGVTLIDNGDPGFRASGGEWEERQFPMPGDWSIGPVSTPLFDDDITLKYGTLPNSNAMASWSFSVSPGRYRVLATYGALSISNFVNKNAVYSIRNGAPEESAKQVGSVTVDHSFPPNGPMYRFVSWKDLGSYTISGNRLSVVLTNPYGLSADAVRIEPVDAPVSSSSSSRVSSAVSSIAPVCQAQPWQGCQEGFICLSQCPNGQCLQLPLDCPPGTTLRYQGICGNNGCLGQCGGCIATTPSSSSISRSSSSRVSSVSSSSAGTCAREGEVIDEASWRPCCSGLVAWPNLAPQPSGQCPDITFSLVCIRQCGNGKCTTGENYCNCPMDCPRPVSSSSAASQPRSSSSAISEQARFCCIAGLCQPSFTPSCPYTSYDQCKLACGRSSSSAQGGRCGDGQLNPGEQCEANIPCPNQEFCNRDTCQCLTSYCGNDRVEGQEQCDGFDDRCAPPQSCSADCRCVNPPPGSLNWRTLGESYLISTISEYALFSNGNYLYIVGGKDFWGQSDDEFRSDNGLSWRRVASLPQPLSNAASLKLGEVGALLLGGLADESSVAHWAFETPNLLTVGFRSNPDLALPVPRYDAAALRVGNRTYLLGGSDKASPFSGSLFGSLISSLIGQTAVARPSREIYVHDGGSWARIQPDLPFHVTKDDAFTIGDSLFILDRSSTRKVYMSNNGSSWTQVSTLPSQTANARLLRPVTHNGSIWLIGKTGSFAGSAAVTRNGTDWQIVSGALPSGLNDFVPDQAVSHQGELWMLGTVSDYYIGGNGRNGKVLATGAAGGPTCGNGGIEGNEQCDDQNTRAGDGCSASCQIESGWTCSGQPSICERSPAAFMPWTRVSDMRVGTSPLASVAYNGNTFVAVGTSGKGAYSTDGINWTAISDMKVGSTSLLSVTYGNGKFVAVGNSGRGAYSVNGINWTAIGDTRSYGEHLFDVTYGNGKFVAVGPNGKGSYSTDGATWTAISDLQVGTTFLNAITYGNGRFVAVGEENKGTYSTDGIRWTGIADMKVDSSILHGITYGNGRFVAVGMSGAGAYSADGQTWVRNVVGSLQQGFSENYLSVTYGAGKFVGVGDGGKGAYAWFPGTGPSSSSSSSAGYWQNCPSGYQCLAQKVNNQCEHIPLDCFNGQLECTDACGDLSSCMGSCCRCVPRSSSSSSSAGCANNGETVYSSSVFGPTSCCSRNAGIRPSSTLVGDMCVAPDNGSLGTCIDNWWQTCGNGTCGTGEDKCTCEQDCPDCTPAGKTAPVIPGAACCPDLTGVNPGSVPQPDGSCPTELPVGGLLCTDCGNGTCEEWENHCNCPQDCSPPGPTCGNGWLDPQEDSQCEPSLNYDKCPLKGLVCDQQNCRCVAGGSSSAQACIQEGKTGPVVQFPPPCCAGLQQISSDRVGPNGSCLLTGGSFTCARCGNGQCGPGENLCNCPQDCQTICPALSPPYCPNGVLVPQLGPGPNGCPQPPVCCNGANNPQAQCSINLKCGNGSCFIESCTCQ